MKDSSNDMEKIIIFGAGIIAEGTMRVMEVSESSEKMNLIGFMVSNRQGNPMTIGNFPVKLEKEWRTYQGKAKILIATKEKHQNSVEKLLCDTGWTNCEKISLSQCITALEQVWKKHNYDIVSYYDESDAFEGLTEEEYLMFLIKQVKSNNIDFEVNLADHCNLNCQCCNHFSPIAEKTFLDIERYESDLKRIQKIGGTDRIGKLMLLGGEPLLHPQIVEVLRITRQYLPMTTIRIVSNGLLIPKMSKDFWSACREYNIYIILTKYPINFDYVECDKIAEREHVTISYELEAETVKTTYRLPIHLEANLNPYVNYAKCAYANWCVVLKEGKFYTCPLVANVGHLNKYYNIEIPNGEDSYIDIYKAESFDDILKKMRQPIPMCAHCDMYNYEYNLEWKVSRREISEWIEK